jgi:hypothetical protein
MHWGIAATPWRSLDTLTAGSRLRTMWSARLRLFTRAITPFTRPASANWNGSFSPCGSRANSHGPCYSA